jgi:signal transduction histidine kinase
MGNNADMLQQMFLDLGIQHQANLVRLVNSESVVAASSNPSEIGIQLNPQEGSCAECHLQPEPQPAADEVVTSGQGSDRIFVVANRVENQIACKECHPEEQASLGVILAEFPAEQLDSWHLPFDTGLWLGSLLLGVLLSGAIYLPLSKQVLEPINLLARSGNEGEALAGLNDFQKVSQRIERMEAALAQRDKTLAEQHRKIDIIFSLKYDIDNPPSLEKFFSQSIRLVQEVTGYDTVTIRIFEPKTRTFRIMAQTGMSPAMLNDLRVIPADAGFHGEVARTKLPAYSSDMENDPRMTSTAPMQAGYRSLVCIPLLAQDSLVGTMQIALKVQHLWEEEELRWLALIGRRVGMLIYQIQLIERLQDVAVLEERSRIAQEIHDGLAQLIGALRLWSDEALVSLEEGHPAAAQRTLRKIENAAREAYASLRDEMLGLRETIFPSTDLLKLITEYLSRFQRQWGIETELRLDGSDGHQHPWPITPAAEIQLLRIIQEGLTNVRRHANASKIVLSIHTSENRLRAKIEDDGIGFDLDQIPENRLGLRIMRERASSVGGSIKITSNSGKGTRLEIAIPLQVAQNIQEGEG